MKTFFRSVIVLLFFGGWALSAAALHVVRTAGVEGSGGSVVVVPKNKLGISDTYVDTRLWTPADVYEHRALVKRLIDSGNASELTKVVASVEGATLEEKLFNVTSTPPAAPKPVAARPAAAAEDAQDSSQPPRLFK